MAAFGSALRSEWLLDPSVTYLNHGTVGAPPRAVIEHQRSIADRIERHPARFVLTELADVYGNRPGSPTLMRAAAAHVAAFVGADERDLVFVDNITTGVNSVLRSFPFDPGDELAVTDLGYGGVTKAVEYAARQFDGSVRTITMPSIGSGPDEFVDAVARGLRPTTRVLVIDHLSANTALVLPVRAIAEVCHDRGVLVLVDGAHVPGNIPLDIESLGVDWYTANLHKWAWAPRSCGFLWAARTVQSDLHPAVTSWGLDNGLAAEFDFPGTRDPTPFLTAPFAIDRMATYGVDDIYTYNHDLVVHGARLVTERWGATFDTPES